MCYEEMSGIYLQSSRKKNHVTVILLRSSELLTYTQSQIIYF